MNLSFMFLTKILTKNLKFVFMLLPVFLISCGEVIGSRDFSTILTTKIAWKNVVNVNASNISSFPLNGTCTVEAGTVMVSVGSPVLTTVALPCTDMRFTGTTDLSSIGLSQGPTDLLATQSVLSADAITNLMVDTVVPLAPVIITPANGSTFGSVSQIISGTCETGSSVKITGDLVGSPISTSCSGGTFSRAINLTSGDGLKTLVAAQTDSVGNISPTDSVIITLNSLLPLAPVITAPTNGTLTNTTAVNVVGTCEAGANVNISGNILATPVSLLCVAGNYNQPITLTAADGAKTISVNQTNISGTSPPVSVTITLDTTAPLAPTITSPTNGSLTNTTAQTVIGACETGANVNISGAIVGSPVTVVCAGSTYSRAVTLTAGDGAKAISATQTDVAGNISPATNISITLDTSAPLAPTITSPTNGSSTNLTAQTIIGACETGATVNISGSIVGSPVTAVCVGSAYSRAVTLTAGDGVKAISATQTDIAGNISPATNISITLDTVVPTVVITSSSGSPTSTSPIPFTVTFSESVTGFISTDITVVNGSVTNFLGGPSVYTIEVTPAGVGVVSVSVAASRAQDVATNNNSASNTINITYQITPPNSFITQWTIPANNTNVTLPLSAGNIFNFTIDWGDGSPITTVTSNIDPDINHTYLTAGSYTVRMTGVIESYGRVSVAPGSCYITNVIQMGYTGWKDLDWAFKYCGGLVNITVNDGLEFSNVISMQGMFYGAGNANPNVSNWDVSNVTNFERMFQLAASANPNVSFWDVSSATTMRMMFSNTTAANPNTTNWNVSSVTNMSNMFSLAQVANPNTTNWNVGNVTNMDSMFKDAPLANPDTSLWNVSNVQYMQFMFEDADSATPNTTNWNVANVAEMRYMFAYTSLANPNTTNWNVSSVYTMQEMFRGALSANPDVTNWNVSNVTNMGGMFADTPLANPNVINWNVLNVTSMNGMFQNAVVATPNTTNWNVSNVTDMNGMFQVASVATPNTTNWNVSKVTDMGYMFFNAPLANPNTTNWNVSAVTNMQNMFYKANSANPNTTNWNVSAVTNMSYMFYQTPIANPDVSLWNVSNVTNMDRMFQNSSIANPDVTNWNVTNVTNLNFMFENAVSANPNTVNWSIVSCSNLNQIFRSSAINNLNYTNFLIMANATSPFNSLAVGTIPAKYQPAGLAARSNLLGPRAWTFIDNGAE